MSNHRVRYPANPLGGPALGRNVNHDPRSRRFPVRSEAPIRSVMHDRRIYVMAQGDLGACTGFAGIGCMATTPFYDTIQHRTDFRLDADGARELYSAATALDDFTGTWPPNDTGSDGLSIAKALLAAGWIAGYEHAFGIDDFLRGLMTRPCIVGTEWLTGMNEPDASGQVSVRGPAEGGHEYQAIGYDAEAELVWFVNSWGTGWGRDGFFSMAVDRFADLLSRNGDATFFTPLGQPAPEALA